MANERVLIVKNIGREKPGLVRTVLQENSISFTAFNPRKDYKFPDPGQYAAVIVFGGPQSANNAEMKSELEFIARTVNGDVPYLGICLGMQALVKAAGGKVERAPFKEVGCSDAKGNYFQVELTKDGINDDISRGLNDIFSIFQLHGETVDLRDGMLLLGSGKGPYQVKNQVVKVAPRAYGIQGHLEVNKQMLE